MRENLKNCKELNKNEPVWAKVLYLFLFPLILLVITLLPIRHGVDVSDTMYSLSSDVLFLKAQGSWNLFMAYYLANFAGFLLSLLPFGRTMLGINFYTAMIVYATVLLVYFYFGKRKQISYPLLFVGEVIAICFCWCPTTVLYNYFSYLLWTIGILILRNALIIRDTKKSMALYVLAGAVFGTSVFAKFPNITIAIMILLVFYHAFLTKEKAIFLWKKVLFCVIGFAAAFAVWVCFLEIMYGKGTYLSMVQSLLAMTDTATDYQSGNMITTILKNYLDNIQFPLILFVMMLAGMILLLIADKIEEKKHISFISTAKIIYVICIPVLIRFLYGRGLFGIDYSSDFAVVVIGVLFLWIVLITAVVVLLKKNISLEDKLDALMLILLIMITPLGSNNGIYPLMDNLFLMIPIGIHLILSLCKEQKNTKTFPIYAILAAMLVLMLVQGIRFRSDYTFKGQDTGKKCDTKIENNAILKGMLTNSDRADALESVLQTADSLLNETNHRYLLTYGNTPGFFFLLKDSTPVMTSTWPDLDSFSLEKYRIELKEIRGKIEEKGMERPLVILTTEVFENMNGEHSSEKEVLLKEFMETLKYDMMFENERYLIFR